MLNKITLIGNLGRDPELTYTPSGSAVTKFSIAVSRHWTDKGTGERKEETTWFDIVAFDRLAETCNTYLHKGSKVYVDGRMTSRKYTGRDNIERTAWSVQLNDMVMLDGKPSAEPARQADASLDVELDDVPF